MPEALLIIDVQNDFLPGGALAVPDGDEVIAPINALAADPRFAVVIATRDWHPPDHQSFAEQGGPWPAHCVQGTSGAELTDRLNREAIDAVIDTGTRPADEGYSGFENPELRELLTPLQTALSMEEGLLDMAERSRSAFVEDVCVLLLAGRSRDPRELVHQLRDQVIPELEEDIALLDATRAAVAVQRRSAQMIGAVLAVLIGAFNTVPVLHDFLVSVQGEITLVIAALIFAGSIAIMGTLLRTPRPARWDVRLVRAELGRIGRG